jgi:hypothetical protein
MLHIPKSKFGNLSAKALAKAEDWLYMPLMHGTVYCAYNLEETNLDCNSESKNYVYIFFAIMCADYNRIAAY